MSDQTDLEAKEKEVQTQHVIQTALSNLGVVVDQLKSLSDKRVDGVLEALDTAKTDLEKQINA